ncbi:bifunctional tetrahydrofolate synthase/dihydrofolate synthase [Pseudoxanthomonas beigongshangi]
MMSLPQTLDDWLAYIEQLHPKSIDMGLERVRAVADTLGLGRPAGRVITVGGTNGKGSTVAFIESIGRAAGWRVAAYTSPHLLRYNERVRIDGDEASDEQLIAAFAAVEQTRGEVPLTYFEFGTLAALWLFQQAQLDLAVLEVGLGGRLDAVNLVDSDVAVITTVDIDHVDWLGPDRESIGREKAGIARAWKPLVLGEIDSPSSVLRHAYAIGANALRLGSDFFQEAIDGQRWRWREVGAELELPNPPLAAPVQRNNAAAAIAALRALDTPPPDAAFAEGIAAARLPGRLQLLVRDGVDIVVDVGHNPQAARELATWLRAQPPAPTHLVYAALADKDAAGVVAAFDGLDVRWHLAGLEPDTPRGQDVASLAGRLADTAAASGQRYATVAGALASARGEASAGARILVFGSFHTAAEALRDLRSSE